MGAACARINAKLAESMRQIALAAVLIRTVIITHFMVCHSMSHMDGLRRGALMTVVMEKCRGEPLNGHPERKQKSDKSQHSRRMVLEGGRFTQRVQVAR